MKKKSEQSTSELLKSLKELPLYSSGMNDLNFSMNECYPNPRLSAAGLTVDFSRASISQGVLNELLSIAESKHLVEHIQLLINGYELNNTEQRAAHHTALRLPENLQNRVEVTATQHEIKRISEQLRTEKWSGQDDLTITDIVNIGIGGSDLGPRMICHALANYADGPKVHFIANVDPRDLECTLQTLSPSNTLIIISSKSFNTTETLENALSARQWLLTELSDDDLSKHVIAVSSNIKAAVEFGVAPENILPMWDWVGGRYSLWSAIGLPIAIATGHQNYCDLLAGAHSMDQHFAQSPISTNLPVLLALLEVWYINRCDAKSIAVLPYSHELRLLPDYLQQLVMESNGKQVDKQGNLVSHRTCATIWGSAGTIGQHSFHQLLHQGTENIPVDFILPLSSHSDNKHKQAHLVANCLAQSKALTEGKTIAAAEQELLDSGASTEEAKRLGTHKASPGNRPNTIITMEKLTPGNLGALIALYEHKVFAQSVIWGINAFDQWGVELGKQLSNPILAALKAETKDSQAPSDATTAHWCEQFIEMHKGS
ncbi:MAG: glucose-6-phosphate isomerase [Cellvibrionales bacterium]|nr:glucose-6-phosphate isomerase [Cellvibrionales bacterium]|tara:strand:- start:523 stop:2154 length:1632 start_codon:yes stop_codon:yes gene_type:complete